LRAAAERLGREAVPERFRIVDRLPVDGDDEIPGLESRARGRAAVSDAGDKRARRAPQLFADATTTRTMLDGIAKPMPCEPPERE
jgi:hypothetical protein